MTMKSSLKLTAVSVGIATLAFTACKSKSNDNTSPVDQSSKKDESKPQKVKNLKVAFKGDIPANGCAEFEITMFNEEGKSVPVTRALNASVSLTGASSKKFKINENEVCANTPDSGSTSDLNLIPVVGKDIAEISVIAPFDNGLIATAKANVVKASETKLTKFQVTDISATEFAVGSTFKFTVSSTYSDSKDEKTKNLIKDLKILDDKGNELTLSHDTDKITKETTYTAKLNNKATQGSALNYKAIANGNLVSEFKVSVVKAKIVKLELFKFESDKSATDVVKVGEDSQFDIVAHYSNDEVKNITKTNHDVEFVSVTSSEPDAIEVTSKPTNAFNQKIGLKIKASTASEYKPVVITLEVRNADTVKIPLYVNEKPKLTAVFSKTVNGTEIKSDTAKIEIPIGGKLLADKTAGCVKLSEHKYELVNTKKTGTVSATDLKVILSDNKNFEKLNDGGVDYFCAKPNALGKSLNLHFVLASDEKMESNVVTITASKAERTNMFVLNPANIDERLSFELNSSTSPLALNKFKFINSDHTVSDEVPTSDHFTVEIPTGFAALFENTIPSKVNTITPINTEIAKVYKEVGQKFSFDATIKPVVNYTILNKSADETEKDTANKVSINFTRTK